MPTLLQSSMRLYTDTVDPTVNEDSSNGYEIGNWWRNSSTLTLFQCDDDSVGAAIWSEKPTFQNGSFTPQLQFGGGTTGITYSTQTGFFQKISPVIFISIIIVLTSKGTSTGTATIAGLPFNGASDVSLSTAKTNITLTSTLPVMKAILPAAASSINLISEGALLLKASLDNTNFADDSELIISGTYFT